jgi:hypothetical protein
MPMIIKSNLDVESLERFRSKPQLSRLPHRRHPSPISSFEHVVNIKERRFIDFVINIDTIELVLLYTCRHCIRSADRICGRGYIGGPEDSHDQLDARSGVLRFHQRALRVCQGSPFISLSSKFSVLFYIFVTR